MTPEIRLWNTVTSICLQSLWLFSFSDEESRGVVSAPTERFPVGGAQSGLQATANENRGCSLDATPGWISMEEDPPQWIFAMTAEPDVIFFFFS